MASPVSVEDLRTRARRRWERDGRFWMAGQHLPACVDIPLHPPTERQVLEDYNSSLEWVHSWRSLRDSDITVVWESRQWSRVGEQQVPVRAKVCGPEAITKVAGALPEWNRWQERSKALQSALGSGPRFNDALASIGRKVGSLPRTDFDRLLLTAKWLLENPTSGLFIRELPIRGIDSKWLGNHRGLVQKLLGRPDLGLRQPPETARVRFLDPTLSPSGITDLSAPLDQLDELDVGGARILIVENLQTFLAFPRMSRVIAVDGGGDKVQVLSQISWVRQRPCVYWGDLDSHGFRILSRARQAGLKLESCLMNSETLLAFKDLWVQEPNPFRTEPRGLTKEENLTLKTLKESDYPRLEQERISWRYALRSLEHCLDSLARTYHTNP